MKFDTGYLFIHFGSLRNKYTGDTSTSTLVIRLVKVLVELEHTFNLEGKSVRLQLSRGALCPSNLVTNGDVILELFW